jgi:hypothetical protein
MWSGMFDGIVRMLWVGMIALLLLIILGVYDLVRWVWPKDKTYESKTILVPKIKLHTDGKVIDTIYVYKIK